MTEPTEAQQQAPEQSGPIEEDSPVSKRELAILVERAMREYDANDPTLGLYQGE